MIQGTEGNKTRIFLRERDTKVNRQTNGCNYLPSVTSHHFPFLSSFLPLSRPFYFFFSVLPSFLSFILPFFSSSFTSFHFLLSLPFLFYHLLLPLLFLLPSFLPSFHPLLSCCSHSSTSFLHYFLFFIHLTPFPSSPYVHAPLHLPPPSSTFLPFFLSSVSSPLRTLLSPILSI